MSIFTALCLVGVAAGYGYFRYRLDSIKTVAAPNLSPNDNSTRTKVTHAQLAPENILLIGNQTRAGQHGDFGGSPTLLSGTLADVIMIVHLDGRGGASILSIPRDLFAPMPAGSAVGPYEKIDAALNDGANGPNNLITAITDDFGIPINHYVEVDFDAFLATVNALGGIKVDFPERLYDFNANLNIPTAGCQLISGATALELVRSRHLQYDPPAVSPTDRAAWPFDPESDLARIARDHTFVKILISTAKSEGLTNPLKANAFLAALLGNLTIDPGLKDQAITLAQRYSSIDTAALPVGTLPVTQVTGPSGAGYRYLAADIGDVEFPVEPVDDAVIRAWDPGALPAPIQPSAVEVFNDVGSAHLADSTATSLRQLGFNVTTAADGTVAAATSETLVQYHPGQLSEGYAVFSKLTGAVMLQADPQVPAGVVAVQAGSTFAVAVPPSTTTPAAGSTAPAPTSTTALAQVTTSSVPTPGGQTPSSSADQSTPYNPRPC